MKKVLALVLQRLSENVTECLELAVSDRQTLAMTLRLIEQEDAVSVQVNRNDSAFVQPLLLLYCFMSFLEV